MPETQSTKSRPSSRSCAEGFSLIEILVALVATCIIASATLTIALSSRGMFETDQQRTTVNQNLRAGMDLLGIDVRQAGERLPWDAPAVELVDGGADGPDELVLRRNLLDFVLPVCKDVNSSTAADAVFVAKKHKDPNKVPSGCYPVLDSNTDGWPDNLEMWRAYRLANGGSVLAYILNPITGLGEFFTYDDEDLSTFHLHRQNPGQWTNSYPVSQRPRIYVLESKRFLLDGDVLQSVINDDTSQALNLVNRIVDLQIRAFLRDGSIVDEIAAGTTWTDLESIEVTLVGQAEFGGRSIERSLTTHFFPRNILSN